MAQKRMLVLCPFPVGVAAGQRLKYEQYFDRWRNQGWEIDVSPFMDKNMWNVIYKKGYFINKVHGTIRGHFRRIFDLFRVPKYDVIYVFMYVTPILTNLMEFLVRLLAKKIVYDIEDNILKRNNDYVKNNPNPLVYFLKWPGKIKFLIRSSDHVITSSPFLNIECKRITDKGLCTYISSSVDTNRYQTKKIDLIKKKVVIGWTGTFSSKQYLDQLQSVFKKLTKKVDFKLTIIGNFSYELPGVDLEVIQWNIKNEIEDLQSFDIGVYPLLSDNWVDGKSGLKAIQYMAIGIPCVASNVGNTSMIINDNVNGFLVNNSDEYWVDILEKLVLDPQLRQKIGKQARLDAENKYSQSVIGNIYDNILQNTVGKYD